MDFKRIHIIVNPGLGREEFINKHFHQFFDGLEVKWAVSVIHKNQHIKKVVKKLSNKTDLIVVFGGDGTVVKVARALIDTDFVMAILPGGTANVMAKELGIPIDPEEALNMINNGSVEVKQIDTGTMNGKPFLIRVNFGIMAEMVFKADRDMKEDFGQLAYGVAAMQSIANVKPSVYKMKIDGKEVIEEGVSLTITNSGNIGIEGFSFLPDISIQDGYLDVILLNDATFLSIMKVAGTTLLQSESEVLKRWKCQEINIQLPSKNHFICDDEETSAKKIKIKVKPRSLNVLVPMLTNN